MEPDPAPPPCWGGVLLCMWPLAAVLGMIVQTFITAWRVDHRRRTRRRHGPAGAAGMMGAQRSRSNSRPRETREEARQRKYRYLYQVRTARGDIISQVIVHLTATMKPFNSIAP